MARTPPVITGLGAVSPLGVGVGAFVRGLRAGASGVRRLDLSEADRGRCVSTVAATCPGFDPRSAMDGPDLRRLPRLVPMALAACREALAQAGLGVEPGDDPTDDARERSRRVALVLGTGAGGIDFTLDQAMAAYGPERAGRSISLWTITNATHGNLAGELSIRLGLRGASLCVSTGCASSSDAIGHAMDMLRADRPGAPDAVLVVGADAHARWETLRGMELLGCVSTRDFSDRASDPAGASRPFDAGRDGFVLGEGAWAVLLERPDAARARGAPALGEALGYGATCDAHHRVRPEPDMREGARAIALALEDAGAAPGAIDAVQYHGTATMLNDPLETRAVRAALGDHASRVPGSSIKSMIGHPQGACGAASVVATLGALNGADADPAGPFLPPTVNLTDPDPECDLDYTPGAARPTGARTALVNCLAFGAKNSALVIRARGR